MDDADAMMQRVAEAFVIKMREETRAVEAHLESTGRPGEFARVIVGSGVKRAVIMWKDGK